MEGMSVYSFKTTQYIPVSLDKAWDFFSRPDNLPSITPPDMRFQIISKYHGEHMYAGQLIEYRVKALSLLPALYWMTEITHVREGVYFIDEQRFGPYSLWHHQHHFREISRETDGLSGVEMTDIVHYKMPLGFIGDLANGMFVGKRLRGIFDYRFQRVESLFGKWDPLLIPESGR